MTTRGNRWPSAGMVTLVAGLALMPTGAAPSERLRTFESAASHRYYFRDQTPTASGAHPETHYDRVIETIIKSLKLRGE